MTSGRWKRLNRRVIISPATSATEIHRSMIILKDPLSYVDRSSGTLGKTLSILHLTGGFVNQGPLNYLLTKCHNIYIRKGEFPKIMLYKVEIM